MDSRVKVIQGGTYAGKTYAIIPILIDLATKKYYPQGITIVAQTIPSVKEGALKIFQNIMQETGRWNSNSYNKTEREYTFHNGTVMKFTAYDDVGKAKQAGKRDILFINEANHIKYDIADALIGRTDYDVFLDFNPDAEFWVHTEIIPMPAASFIVLTYKDNEALPDSQLERLMYKKHLAEKEETEQSDSNRHRNWWNVYGLGLTGKIEGLCYPEITIIDKIPLDAELMGYGMDFGYVNDPTTLVACYKLGNNIYLDQLIYETGLLPERIRDKAEQLQINMNELTVSDNDQMTIDQLKYSGNGLHWWIKPTKKFSGCITTRISIMNDYNLHLTKKSKGGIREAGARKWEVDENGKALNKPVSGNDHFWDAAEYLCCYKLSSKFK